MHVENVRHFKEIFELLKIRDESLAWAGPRCLCDVTNKIGKKRACYREVKVRQTRAFIIYDLNDSDSG